MSPTPILTAATLALLLSLAAHGASPDGTLRIWAGGTLVAEVPTSPPGHHLGPEFVFGDATYRAHWVTGERPMLVTDRVLPTPQLPSRKELIVVTTLELAGESEMLQPYLDFRRAEGFQVTLATEAQWDHPSDTPTDDRADRIRAWLMEGWKDVPGAFLLLIGDPDPEWGDVPMKMVHPLQREAQWYPEWLAEDLDPIPTDLYYADLSKSWDCNHNGVFAEYPVDQWCVDFGTELFVGRLPVYGGDVAQLDRLLERLLAHDREQDKTYRSQVLLPAAMIALAGAPAPMGDDYGENDDGACVTDTVYRDLPPAFQAGATRMYEEGGLVHSPYPHERALSQGNVLDVWSGGQGLVLWYGHGAPDGAYRMIWAEDWDGDGEGDWEEFSYPPFVTHNDWSALEDAPSAFTFHISCSNGVPEEEHNIGATLLQGGAVATASSSRVAFGESAPWGETWEPQPNQALAATTGYYWAMLLADGLTVGEAMAFTKYGLSGDGLTAGYGDYAGFTRATKMEYNLYGDPTRSLELCASDPDCDDGSSCNGAETCDSGFCIHTASIDCTHLDDVCTVGSCDTESGDCVALPRIEGAACDDGLWCTEGDTCEAGVCAGIERECGNREGYHSVCVEDEQTCDFIAEEVEGKGMCQHAPVTGGWLLLLAPALFVRRRPRR
ncbi:MAG: hypothetical protein JRI25_07815 [Deltaproteobacteria bacterium]|nr:hypothetical protein [Deltaproteobacteria bacterium]